MWVHSLSAYSHECQIISGSVALILDSRFPILASRFSILGCQQALSIKFASAPLKVMEKKYQRGAFSEGLYTQRKRMGKAPTSDRMARLSWSIKINAPHGIANQLPRARKKNKKKKQKTKNLSAQRSVSVSYTTSVFEQDADADPGDTTIQRYLPDDVSFSFRFKPSLSFQVDQRQCPGAAIPIWWSAVFQLTASGIARVPVVYPISLIYTDIPDSRSAVANTMRLPIGAAMKTTLFFLATATATATLTGQQGVTLDKKKHLVISIECV